MVQLTAFFAIWTSLVAILLSVLALADNSWPDEVNTIAFGKRTIAVFLYIFTIIAASLTLWETWKSMGGGGGGGY